MKRFFGYTLVVLSVVWSLQLLMRLLVVVGVLSPPFSHNMSIVWAQLFGYIALVWAAVWGGRKLLGAAAMATSDPPHEPKTQALDVTAGPKMAPPEQAVQSVVRDTMKSENAGRQYLQTQASRISLLAGVGGLFFWAIGLWLSNWRLGRYIDRSIEQPLHYLVETAFFWVGVLLFLGGAVGALAYDQTFGRLVAWIRAGDR